MKRLKHLFGVHYDGSICGGVPMNKVYWRVHRDTASCMCMYCGKMIPRPTLLEESEAGNE